MGKFCENCGAQLNEDQAVCLKCGAFVKKEKPVEKKQRRPGNFVLNAAIYNTALFLMAFFTLVGLAFYIVKIDYLSIVKVEVTGFSILSRYPGAIANTGMSVSVYCLIHLIAWIAMVVGFIVYAIVIVNKSSKFTKEEGCAFLKKKFLGQSNFKLVLAIGFLLMSLLYMIMSSVALGEVSENFNDLYYDTMAYGMFIADLLFFIPFLVFDILMRNKSMLRVNSESNVDVSQAAVSENYVLNTQNAVADASTTEKTECERKEQIGQKEDVVNRMPQPSGGKIVVRVVNALDGKEKIMRMSDNVKSSILAEKLIPVFGLAEVGKDGEKIEYALFKEDEYDQIDGEATLVDAGIKQKDTVYIRKALLEI